MSATRTTSPQGSTRKAATMPKNDLTIAKALDDLLTEISADATHRAKGLTEHPLAWEGTRNAIDRLRGVEISRIVAHHAEVLEKSDLASWKTFYDHLRTARLSVAVSGGGAHVVKGIEEVVAKTASVVESFYLTADKRSVQA